jgi:hypothetical protein
VITFSKELQSAIRKTADYVCSDGGSFTRAEVVEMVLDRLTGGVGKEVGELVRLHGYGKVEREAMKYL